jgi:2',3'-cyclic-nucleotide 2'-phosphodiesterase (5'-nucleotidase family)
MRTLKLVLCALLLVTQFRAPELRAEVIQLIHTNDLHSYFQGTRRGLGGYARLKTVIKGLRDRARARGIQSLYLDGGDFGEGSSFYFSNHGVDSLRALDLLGVDVTVLGNHDFILGGPELRRQILVAKLRARMLSANLGGKRLLRLEKLLPDSVDVRFGDVTLRVIGLTTDEIHYVYPLRPLGFIRDPIKAGIREARRARAAGVDFTIALTHIGLTKDIELVEKTREVDLVVGGHTHIVLPRPMLQKNLEGRLIPILQAGAHSGHVGVMTVDVRKGEAPVLVDYELVQIDRSLPEDAAMRDFVAGAAAARERYFGGRRWDEVIGETEIPLTGNVNGQDGEKNSCWSRHIAKFTREAAGAELGLQFDVFQGEQIDPGTVTFGDVVDNFPHFRRWGDKGWKVTRTRVNGFLLRQIVEFLANSELALQITIDGLTVQDKDGEHRRFDPRRHPASAARVNGERIQGFRDYTIALPSEIPFGAFKLANVLALVLLQNLRAVPDSEYWVLFEDYLRKNSPLRCLE